MTINLTTPPDGRGGRMGSYGTQTPRTLREAISFLLGTALSRPDENVLLYATNAIILFAREDVGEISSEAEVVPAGEEPVSPEEDEVEEEVEETPAPVASGGHGDVAGASESFRVEVVEDAPVEDVPPVLADVDGSPFPGNDGEGAPEVVATEDAEDESDAPEVETDDDDEDSEDESTDEVEATEGTPVTKSPRRSRK